MASSQRTCSACGAGNRIPARHLAHVGRCGRCQAPLPAQNHPVDVDEATFDAIVKDAGVPVLIDFWAPWCAPCRAAAPGVDQAAQQLQGKAVVLKVNTDQQPGLAARYGVRGIPMFAVVKDGQLVAQQTGVVDARRLVSMVGDM